MAPDCQMCWNDWPSLTETPFVELAGIQVCRNCGRSMKQMLAFCRNHGLELIPQVGINSEALKPAPMDEPSPTPSTKQPRKGS